MLNKVHFVKNENEKKSEQFHKYFYDKEKYWSILVVDKHLRSILKATTILLYF